MVEKVATLDQTLRSAQATQRSLPVEWELVERCIKSLRTKIGITDTNDEEEQTA